MRVHKYFIHFLLLTIITSCATEKDHLVTIHTKYGDIRMILYDETPKHKENFLKLAKEGLYDSTIFHRVIDEFMIQGGDVNMKKGMSNKINYTIPAEFNSKFFHEKGAVAAARMGDEVNPQKASSGCQFYIVDGKTFSTLELDAIEDQQNASSLQRNFVKLLQMPQYESLRNEIMELQRSGNYPALEQKVLDSKDLIEKEFGKQTEYTLSEAQRQAYTNKAGSPHLDGGYTVFGKVVDGLSVVDSISAVRTRPGDRPEVDLFMTVEVEEISKKKIEKVFGYKYPEKEKKESEKE